MEKEKAEKWVQQLNNPVPNQSERSIEEFEAEEWGNNQ